MSWLVFLGNLAKILFLDSHARIIQVCTYLDVFLPCNMARSWQDFPCFIMFLIMAITFRFTGLLLFLRKYVDLFRLCPTANLVGAYYLIPHFQVSCFYITIYYVSIKFFKRTINRMSVGLNSTMI